MKIKICGLFRQEDIAFSNEVRPDYIGFVFAKSKRQVTKEQAAQLRQQLSPDIQAVGVFVDAPLSEIAEYLESGIIDIAQLHGDETEEDIQYLQAVTGKPVIKAVRVQSRYAVEAWLDSSADYLLFDSGAGSGEGFDWSVLEGVDRDFFLAGGLNSANIAQAMEQVNAYGLDVSSGVETDGVKDAAKMQEVVRRVRDECP